MPIDLATICAEFCNWSRWKGNFIIPDAASWKQAIKYFNARLGEIIILWDKKKKLTKWTSASFSFALLGGGLGKIDREFRKAGFQRVNVFQSGDFFSKRFCIRRSRKGYVYFRVNRREGPVLISCRVDGFLAQDVIDHDLTVFIRRVDDDVLPVQSWELASAARTVVVGNDNEFIFCLHSFSIVRQIFDAARVFIRQTAVNSVFGRLGYVDLISNAIDHIEVVSWERFIHQSLFFGFLHIDLVKLASGALQPLLQLGTVNQHGFQRVRVDVEIRDTFLIAIVPAGMLV
jgi:hypothetical protein